MLNDYELGTLADLQHQDDIAAADRWRLASQVALANRPALPIRRRWLAGLGAWLERLGCTLRARYGTPAQPGQAACPG